MAILENSKAKTVVEDKKQEDLKIYNPKEIYLITTCINSNYSNGSGAVSRNMKQYYLATKENEKYYELFSKVELMMEERESKIGTKVKYFNSTLVEKVQCMKEQIANPNQLLSAKELFYFITELNTNQIMK